MKKIVIIPTFASSHFLDHWIRNVVDVINPDVILIREGIMPSGPENKGHIDAAFREKWCYNGGSAGFDWLATEEILEKWYDSGLAIGWQINEYQTLDANECFLTAISDFSGVPMQYQPNVGDVIIPIEPDAFHLEVNKQKIQDAIGRLEIGQGISTRWVDFLETQYYTEAINLVQPKYRRFAYRFDNMENYRAAMSGFMSQNYTRLQKCDDFITYHYPWFVCGSWKQLRYDLIYRSDPQYWKDFESGLVEIRGVSESLEAFKKGAGTSPYKVPEKIVIRPSRSDEGRYAKFIDIEHPDAIKNHPNFVK